MSNFILASFILLLIVAALFEVFFIPIMRKRKIKKIINPLCEKYKGTIWEPYVQFADIYLRYAQKLESRMSLNYSPFNEVVEQVDYIIRFANECDSANKLKQLEVPLKALSQNLNTYLSKGKFKDSTKEFENLIGANTVLRWRIQELEKSNVTFKKPNQNA